MPYIFARHRKLEEDAIRIWFTPVDWRWNKDHRRFESWTETEGLYWFWIDEAAEVVMIISCFDRRDDL